MLVSLSIIGRLDSYMASLGGDSAAHRIGVKKEWLRFLSPFELFSLRFFVWLPPLACGLRAMVNVILPFQLDVTSMRYVLGKFGYWLSFTVCSMDYFLDVPYSMSRALKEVFRCLSQNRFPRTLNQYIHIFILDIILRGRF